MTSPSNLLITFAVFAYNQEQFIEEAVQSALSQSYQPLEIILSDDCSSDKTFSIIEDVIANYNGPHKVIVNRNKENLGLGEHVNLVGSMANGALLVLAAGDDFSESVRTKKIFNAWLDAHCPISVIYSDFLPIDSSSRFAINCSDKLYGNKIEIHDMARGLIRVLGATSAYSIEVF